MSTLQETKEYLLIKLAEVRASLPGINEKFEAADREFTDALGRELLGEATPKEVAHARTEADIAKRRVAATKGAETVLCERLRETDRAIVAQERSEMNDKSAMAAVVLPEAVAKVRELAEALGCAFTLAAQLDACVRRDKFVRTGQSLNEAIGSPFGELAKLGIAPFVGDGFKGLRFSSEPRQLTFAELAALCGDSVCPKKEEDNA
jgi:hypothetical protein